MKRRFSCFPSVLLLFVLVGCSPWGTGLPDHIAAEVNGEKITVEEFDREVKELVIEQSKEGKPSGFKELKKVYLDQMVERKILVQEARRSGIKISQEELDQTISEIKKDYPGEGFGEKLGLKGIRLEEWKAGLEEKLLAEKMIRNAQRFRGEIEEKEALEYYETHRSIFQIPRKVRVRQIVVADGEEAIQILKRLKRGESFEKLAMAKSLGPEKVRGGDLGFFSQGERPSEFDHVFSMEVGTISEVIKSPYGYHIFKLEERAEPREITFEEARPELIKELKKKKGEEEYQQWFKGLKEKARIKINRKWLKS